MASFTQKRLSLHTHLEHQERQIDGLKRRIEQLGALANIGSASCMVAHEINNLLTPVKSYAELALKDPDNRMLAEKAFEKTVRNCGRASKIMESMLALANGGSQEKNDVRVMAMVEEVFTCLARDFSKDGIQVEIKVPEELTVRVVRVQMEQVLMNLVLNARDAMVPRGGILTIEGADKGDSAQIELTDTGVGIEPEDLKNIFEMFFSTKTRRDASSGGSGTGLGLAFCKEIIDAHSGLISVESKPSRGSTFRITLPKTGSGAR